MSRQRKNKKFEALAILDMDGTLLDLRSLDVLCQELGLETELRSIEQKAHLMEEHEISKEVAQLFRGRSASVLEEVFDRIKIVCGVKEFVDYLKERNFMTTIITDSYTFLASRLAERLGIDAVYGNVLEMADGMITGRVAMPLGWEKQKDCRKKAVCKLHVMLQLARENDVGLNRTLAVGDSKGDFCIIERAAIGVAFRPRDPEIIKVADLVVYGDFFELADRLKPFLIGFQ